MSQDQKIVKDERGQDQPADKKRAQQNTAAEGGAAYAPRNQDLKGPAKPGEQAQGLSGEDKRQGSLRTPSILPTTCRKDYGASAHIRLALLKDADTTTTRTGIRNNHHAQTSYATRAIQRRWA